MTLNQLPAQLGYSALLLIDGSAHPPTKMGVAGYRLIAAQNKNLQGANHFAQRPVSETLTIKTFQPTSSTHLEIHAALWALEEVAHYNDSLAIVSDCQTLCQLTTRRSRLEAMHFCNRQGQLLALGNAYKQLFAHCDHWLLKTGQPLGFIQLKGHCKPSQRDELASEFADLDQAIRKVLRGLI